MNNNPLLKYLVKDNKENFFHTSRYARMQNGTGMGAASVESFTQRRKIDQNRTRVKKYSDSRIVAQAMTSGERAKTYTPPEKNDGGFGRSAGAIGNTNTTASKVGGVSARAAEAGRASLGGRTAGISGGPRPPMLRH